MWYHDATFWYIINYYNIKKRAFITKLLKKFRKFYQPWQTVKFMNFMIDNFNICQWNLLKEFI